MHCLEWRNSTHSHIDMSMAESKHSADRPTMLDCHCYEAALTQEIESDLYIYVLCQDRNTVYKSES